MTTHRLWLALLYCGLAACSGTPIQNEYYLLRPEGPTETRPLTPSTAFAMGEVNVAPYIDQPGLVLETGNGQVRPARNHRWAEPLPRSLRMLLTTEVSRALAEDILPARFSDADTRFNVQIEQLHGTADGDALLVAYWWIVRDGETLASYQFVEREPLAGDGYSALALAQRRLLRTLAVDIAASLEATRVAARNETAEST
ncbi:MAG: PqiC family protein [Halieaceae bacterium]|nr:PqiC family protein [Halieaceae bacterium]